MVHGSGDYRVPAFAAAVLVLPLLAMCVPADVSEADASISVTDGYGTLFTFSDEPAHVATIGKGVTATVIQLGGINKIVVADSYSKADSNSVFDPLRSQISAGKTAAGGNIYSSGSTQLKTDIVDAADNGRFDKDKDPVFITGGNSYISPIVEELRSKGFKKVMAWNDITEYDSIPIFVGTISRILSGTEAPVVEQMRNVPDTIEAGLSGHPLRDAFYVTYSGSAFKVGNINSLANSMIIAAGGNSITTDDSKAKPTYEANLTALIDDHPDAVIFLDTSISGNADRLNALKIAVGETAYNNAVPLESLWNNYSVESMNGVWIMACAMYPDLFTGDVPSVDKSQPNNVPAYLSVSCIAALAICIGGTMFLRKQ